jgi:hypothetical protein
MTGHRPDSDLQFFGRSDSGLAKPSSALPIPNPNKHRQKCVLQKAWWNWTSQFSGVKGINNGAEIKNTSTANYI